MSFEFYCPARDLSRTPPFSAPLTPVSDRSDATSLCFRGFWGSACGYASLVLCQIRHQKTRIYWDRRPFLVVDL